MLQVFSLDLGVDPQIIEIHDNPFVEDWIEYSQHHIGGALVRSRCQLHNNSLVVPRQWRQLPPLRDRVQARRWITTSTHVADPSVETAVMDTDMDLSTSRLRFHPPVPVQPTFRPGMVTVAQLLSSRPCSS
ncbi:hypothetical protein EMPS_09937 [Entomortierella parvispora]|uniref:Uncharacterized protein n=1 Tax=Entomortierella parvispora TaxID=205924 RepID=A0A9P3HJB8_9FUNG|nr:hypothetical protein EMPS_09937 [Entomortierella parvispora]